MGLLAEQMFAKHYFDLEVDEEATADYYDGENMWWELPDPEDPVDQQVRDVQYPGLPWEAWSTADKEATDDICAEWRTEEEFTVPDQHILPPPAKRRKKVSLFKL